MIPCDRCGQRPATRVIAHPQAGFTMPLRVCDQCAQDLPVTDPVTTAMALFQVQLPALQTCPRCGTAFQALCQSTLLGCGHCYSFYRVHIDALVQRVQGTCQHRGKGPVRKGRSHRQRQALGRLKERLRLAIDEERYEDAAVLRDEIQRMLHESGETP
ncbi:MAG: UvrB/UvrC motif-containing protein [Candidatus Eremiobacterota bacterium]